MKFPNLTLTENEKLIHKNIGESLVKKIQNIFISNYGLKPSVKCTGSTIKGTALPEKYFGIDFDVSVKANEELIDLIAYKSEEFEGCQLFSLKFFSAFAEHFKGLYFAGHRISGKINNRKYDFSITDINKDKWKWDFNSSSILQYTPEQLREVKKTKYFLKSFNVYGSELYGIVGPAVELGIHYHHTCDKLIEYFRNFSEIESNMGDQFRSVKYPQEFYDIFPESEDPIHIGLVRSFRYTIPNTYNRLIKSSKCNEISIDELISLNSQYLDFVDVADTNNERLISYLLSISLKDEERFDLEIILTNEGVIFYSSGNRRQNNLLKKVIKNINELHKRKEFNYGHMPKEIQDDLLSRYADLNLDQYTFFIGTPNFPLDRLKIYVPFDFFIRADARKLIKIMGDGQYESK